MNIGLAKIIENVFFVLLLLDFLRSQFEVLCKSDIFISYYNTRYYPLGLAILLC